MRREMKTLEPSSNNVEGMHNGDGGETCGGAGGGVLPLPLLGLGCWRRHMGKIVFQSWFDLRRGHLESDVFGFKNGDCVMSYVYVSMWHRSVVLFLGTFPRGGSFSFLTHRNLGLFSFLVYIDDVVSEGPNLYAVPNVLVVLFSNCNWTSEIFFTSTLTSNNFGAVNTVNFNPLLNAIFSLLQLRLSRFPPSLLSSPSLCLHI